MASLAAGVEPQANAPTESRPANQVAGASKIPLRRALHLWRDIGARAKLLTGAKLAMCALRSETEVAPVGHWWPRAPIGRRVEAQMVAALLGESQY